MRREREELTSVKVGATASLNRCALSEGRVELAELLRGLAPKANAAAAVRVGGVSGSIGSIEPGDLYVALEPTLDTIRTAIQRGAAAIMAEGPHTPVEVPYVRVPDALRAFCHLVDRASGRPSAALEVIGLLRGEGCRRVATMLERILRSGGRVCESIPARALGGPGSLEVQTHLAEARSSGVRAAILDCRPADVAMGRFEGVRLRAAVVCGLQPRPGQGFRSAEAMLESCLDVIRGMPHGSVVIADADDPVTELMFGETRAEVLTFGTDRQATLRTRVLRADDHSTRLAVSGSFGVGEFTLPFLGESELKPVLAAVTLAAAMGTPLSAAFQAAAGLGDLAGLRPILLPRPYRVFGDSRRSVRALAQSLATLRGMTQRTLHVVAAPRTRSASIREAEQRARTLEEGADDIILTSEQEGPDSTAWAALFRGFSNFERVRLWEHRAQALEAGLEALRGDDVLLIAGLEPEDERALKAWFLRGLCEGLAS